MGVRIAGQPPAPPWRNEHRSATTTYRHYDDGRVSIVWHHRVEAQGPSTLEVVGASKDEAERLWEARRSKITDEQVARSRRRAKWGLAGGWQT